MIRFLFLLIATNLERFIKFVFKFVFTTVIISLFGWDMRLLLLEFMDPSRWRTFLLLIGWFLQHFWWFLPLLLSGLLLFFLLIITILSLVPIRYKLDAKVDSIEGVIATIYVTYLFRFIRLLWEIKDGVTVLVRQIGASTRIISSDDEAVKEKKKEKRKKAEEKRKKKLEEKKKKEEQKKPADYAKLLEVCTKYIVKDSSKHYKAVEGEPPSGLEVLETLFEMKDDAMEKLNSILTYPHLKTIINLVKRASKKVGRALHPQHIDINQEFGFADPTLTAMSLHKLEVFVARYGFGYWLNMEPDYEVAERIENAKATKQGQLGLIASVLIAIGLSVRININMYGRLRLFSVIWPFVWLLTRRPIRREIRRGIRFATDVYFNR